MPALRLRLDDVDGVDVALASSSSCSWMVVAVEDGPALVAGQEHGDPFGDAGADQVAGGRAAAIVEEPS